MGLSDITKKSLQSTVNSPVLWDAPLSAWTTFRIGGPADALVNVNDTGELHAVIALCDKYSTRWKLLGRGSNILVSDRGFPGVIVVLGDGFKQIHRQTKDDSKTVLVRAGAAISVSRLGEWAAEQALSGLEFAAGIPGTLGGALAMNAGAWGHEIGSLVNRVELIGADGARSVSADDLSFSYRCWDDLNDSLTGFVVTTVTMMLLPADTIRVREKMKELRRQRLEQQPVGMPNAGSFFKNPAGRSAGQLIDASGLKGVRVGDAEISEKHANFFVNRGKATADEMIELMHLVQDRVKRDSDIVLEPEVHFL